MSIVSLIDCFLFMILLCLLHSQVVNCVDTPLRRGEMLLRYIIASFVSTTTATLSSASSIKAVVWRSTCVCVCMCFPLG